MLITDPRAFEMETGKLRPAQQGICRRLQEMRALFGDREAAERILAAGGGCPISEACLARIEEVAGRMPCRMTWTQPGRIGGEARRTKGHASRRSSTGPISNASAARPRAGGGGYWILPKPPMICNPEETGWCVDVGPSVLR